MFSLRIFLITCDGSSDSQNSLLVLRLAFDRDEDIHYNVSITSRKFENLILKVSRVPRLLLPLFSSPSLQIQGPRPRGVSSRLSFGLSSPHAGTEAFL